MYFALLGRKEQYNLYWVRGRLWAVSRCAYMVDHGPADCIIYKCMYVGREGAEPAFLMIAGRGTAPHWPAILVLVSIPVMDVLFPFPSDAISWSVLCSPAPRLRRPPLARDSPPRGARGAVLPIDVRRRCPKGRHGISTVV